MQHVTRVRIVAHWYLMNYDQVTLRSCRSMSEAARGKKVRGDLHDHIERGCRIGAAQLAIHSLCVLIRMRGTVFVSGGVFGYSTIRSSPSTELLPCIGLRMHVPHAEFCISVELSVSGPPLLASTVKLRPGDRSPGRDR